MREFDIDKLLKLARLYLSPEAKEKLKPSLLKIVEYFQTIRGFREKSPPTSFSEFPCPRRQEEERVHEGLKLTPDYLQGLPNYENGYFRVPKMRE
ncbi:MAG: Asp-tRNA(Asn)/Glu-tRNA(Gln) amidotransferase subunit GatC [candidate division WOR-3 bacterium]